MVVANAFTDAIVPSLLLFLKRFPNLSALYACGANIDRTRYDDVAKAIADHPSLHFFWYSLNPLSTTLNLPRSPNVSLFSTACSRRRARLRADIIANILSLSHIAEE